MFYRRRALLGLSKLPAAFQAVEYIQSSGTQYIITDISCSNAKGIYIDWVSPQISTEEILVGCRDSGGNRYFIGYYNGTFTRLYYGWNSLIPSNNERPIITANTRTVATLNYLNSRKITMNSTGVSFECGISESLQTAATNISVFAAANPDSSVIRQSSIRLYALKISDGNSIVGNFVPCYRKLDGEIGLFDLISKNFYTNDGTGTFTKGADV